MLVGQPLEQVGGLAHLLGVERRRVAAQLGDDRRRPGRASCCQSSTASRTSRSTRWMSSTIASGSSPSGSRSISTCIHDSRTASPSGLEGAVRRPGVTDCSAPVMSRTTSKLGWMTTCTSRSCRDSSMVSESTRNGMSSTTTSTTVWPPADQPCSASVGVSDPHLGGALGAAGGQLVVRGEGAVDVDVGAVERGPRARRGGSRRGAARRPGRGAARRCPCRPGRGSIALSISSALDCRTSLMRRR